MLNEYAYDAEHSNNGERVRDLEAWNEKGYDAWRREKHQQS